MAHNPFFQVALKEYIASGGHGIVFKVYYKEDENELYAVKIIPNSNENIQTTNSMNSHYQEPYVMHQLGYHKCLATFYGAQVLHAGKITDEYLNSVTNYKDGWYESLQNNSSYALFYKYYAYNFEDYFEKITIEDKVIFLAEAMVELCDLLYYCETKGIVHCDIRPSNILIEKTFKGKKVTPILIDFGESSNRIEFPARNYVLSFPGEELNNISSQSDLYCLGFLFDEYFNKINLEGEEFYLHRLLKEKYVRFINEDILVPKDERFQVLEAREHLKNLLKESIAIASEVNQRKQSKLSLGDLVSAQTFQVALNNAREPPFKFTRQQQQ